MPIPKYDVNFIQICIALSNVRKSKSETLLVHSPSWECSVLLCKKKGEWKEGGERSCGAAALTLASPIASDMRAIISSIMTRTNLVILLWPIPASVTQM